ncbi:hypothetical protein ACFSX8_00165 [Acinetobacter gyllenbergii]|uniref:hypothetical protein n=1 Tax=Acinetobacter gyllenbergii TaxID=134534 RepID=UPI003627E3B1
MKTTTFSAVFKRRFKMAASAQHLSLTVLALVACSKNSDAPANQVHELRYQSLTV